MSLQVRKEIQTVLRKTNLTLKLCCSDKVIFEVKLQVNCKTQKKASGAETLSA